MPTQADAIARMTPAIKILIPTLSNEEKIVKDFDGVRPIADAIFKKGSDFHIPEEEILIKKPQLKNYLSAWAHLGEFILRSKYVLGNPIDTIDVDKLSKMAILTAAYAKYVRILVAAQKELTVTEQEEFKKVATILAKKNRHFNTFLIITALWEDRWVVRKKKKMAMQIAIYLAEKRNKKKGKEYFEIRLSAAQRAAGTLYNIGQYILKKEAKIHEEKNNETYALTELTKKDWNEIGKGPHDKLGFDALKNEYQNTAWDVPALNALERKRIIDCANLFNYEQDKKIAGGHLLPINQYKAIINKILAKENEILEHDGIHHLTKAFRNKKSEFYIPKLRWAPKTIKNHLFMLRILGGFLLRYKVRVGGDIKGIPLENFEAIFKTTQSKNLKQALNAYQELDERCKSNFKKAIVVLDKASTTDRIFFVTLALLENQELPKKCGYSVDKVALKLSDGIYKFKRGRIGKYRFRIAILREMLTVFKEIGEYLELEEEKWLLTKEDMKKIGADTKEPRSFERLHTYYFTPVWKDPARNRQEQIDVCDYARLFTEGEEDDILDNNKKGSKERWTAPTSNNMRNIKNVVNMRGKNPISLELLAMRTCKKCGSPSRAKYYKNCVIKAEHVTKKFTLAEVRVCPKCKKEWIHISDWARGSRVGLKKHRGGSWY